MSFPRAIILAAGRGTRLSPLSDGQPKCMVPLRGRPLLHWQLDAIRNTGVNDIVVVAGYMSERMIAPECRLVLNHEYSSTNMVWSLLCAQDWFDDGFIMSYGDIIYSPQIYRTVVDCDFEIGVVVDRFWHSYWEQRTTDVLADAESLRIDASGRIQSIGQKVENIAEIQGQYIGLVVFRDGGIEKARVLVEREREANRNGRSLICPERTLRQLYMTDLLQGLINEGIEVRPIWIDGGWLEIDTLSDLTLAGELSIISNQLLLIKR